MRPALATARFLLALLGRPAPARRAATELDAGGERLRAWSYVPRDMYVDSTAPTILAIHGLTLRGPDDPRLDAVCRAFAGVGCRVIAPELPDAVRLRIGDRDIDRIARSIVALADRRPIGVFSASFSAALCLIAAARTGDAVAGVCAIGAYGDARSAVAHAMRGRGVDPYARMIVLRTFAAGPERWSPALLAAIDLWLAEDCLRPPDPRFAAVRAALAADERALLDDLLAAGPATQAIGGRVIDAGRAMIEAIDVTRVAAAIRGHVALIHGADDAVIDPAESVALASRLAHGRACVTPLLSHGDHTRGPRALLQVPPIFATLHGFFAALARAGRPTP